MNTTNKTVQHLYAKFALGLRQLIVAIALWVLAIGQSLAATAPILSLDKGDYLPGETVLIRGFDFSPGQNLVLHVLHPDGTPSEEELAGWGNHGPYQVTCDGFGEFTYNWVVCEDCYGEKLVLEAEDPFSGALLARVMFTDAGGAYTIKWYAADPAVNRAPYLPTYRKQPPSALQCPTPTGGVGRAVDPLAEAVAYGPNFLSSDLDAVTSLAPKTLQLGQIVPFEVEIKVSGSTAPENGKISFIGGFNTHTTSGDDFGYDPAYMIYCAFVDTKDKGTIDPGNNAKVESFTSALANPGGGATEEIQGTFTVSGLDSGDNIIVEIWVVLKPTIPPSSSGNVQTRLIDANTIATPPDAISTGNQTVPLLFLRGS